VADCHVGCNIKKLEKKKKKKNTATTMQQSFSIFVISKFWKFFKKKIGKLSRIYTRKTKNSKIFPISLSKNGEILPKTSTTIMQTNNSSG
jgi:hypothetical protein